MIILSLLLAFIGCMSLALCLNRSWKVVTGYSLVVGAKRVASIFRWILLGLSLVVSIVIEGLGFGVLVWALFIAAASFVVAMMLSFYPRLLRSIARFYVELFPPS